MEIHKRHRRTSFEFVVYEQTLVTLSHTCRQFLLVNICDLPSDQHFIGLCKEQTLKQTNRESADANSTYVILGSDK